MDKAYLRYLRDRPDLVGKRFSLQSIIFGIGYLWRIVPVIGGIRPRQNLGKLGQPRPSFIFTQPCNFGR